MNKPDSTDRHKAEHNRTPTNGQKCTIETGSGTKFGHFPIALTSVVRRPGNPDGSELRM
jgi:hypothetical protein